MRTFAEVLLAIPLVLLVLPVCLYLGLLTLAAPLGARRRPPASRQHSSFAVVVPAHDEESVIGRLLSSVAAIEYPAERVDVYVIADNCTDATAAIARIHGALVFERNDAQHAGKGQALQWLLQELERAGRRYDAYLFLDADSVVSPNFLSSMNDRICAGQRVIQGYYTVLPVRDTPTERLREVGLALVHFLRPAAKMAFGGSCGLKGNGMAFHRSVIERFGWPTTGLAEDVEFHLQLVSAGLKVTFAPEAIVQAEMPVSLRAAQSQNQRWEAGRLATARGQGLRLLGSGLRQRDAAALDAGFEQLVPPLSVPLAVAGVSLTLGVVWGLRDISLLAVVLLMVVALHICVGIVMAGVRMRTCLALGHVPAYVAWKLAIYFGALVRRDQVRWTRTARAATK